MPATLVGQQELGAGPALVLVVDAVLDRHLDVLEPDLVDLVLAAQGDDRSHGHARRLHVDQQERDAFLDLGGRVGADQAEDPVAVLGQGGPGLLAVDQVVFLAVVAGEAFGLGLQAGEVRTRARLRIALGPPDVARQGRRQEAFLLLGRGEGVDHRPDHVDAERQDRHAVGAGGLFGPDVALDRGPARAAVLLRPGRGHPALLGQGAVPGQEVFLGHFLALLLLLTQAGGVVLGDEGADLVAERDVFGREIEVHGGLPEIGPLGGPSLTFGSHLRVRTSVWKDDLSVNVNNVQFGVCPGLSGPRRPAAPRPGRSPRRPPLRPRCPGDQRPLAQRVQQAGMPLGGPDMTGLAVGDQGRVEACSTAAAAQAA
jgi:hypothetical protein